MLIDILSTVSLKCGKWWKWWERSKQTKMSIGWHGASSEEPFDGPTNQHVMVLANFCVSFLQETPAWAFGWVLIIISNNPIVTSRIHCVACPCQCIQCCLDESWWIHTPSSPTLYNSTTWSNRDSVTSEHWSISRREPNQESNIPNFYYIYIYIIFPYNWNAATWPKKCLVTDGYRDAINGIVLTLPWPALSMGILQIFGTTTSETSKRLTST